MAFERCDLGNWPIWLEGVHPPEPGATRQASPQRAEGSILCTKCIHAPSAYNAGCTTDASAARMCGGVAAATGISGAGEF